MSKTFDSSLYLDADIEDVRSQRRLGVYAGIFGAASVHLLLGAYFLSLHQTEVGYMMVLLGLIILFCIFYFNNRNMYKKYVSNVLLISLLSPFVGSLALGGIYWSGYSIIWCFVTPIVSLLMDGSRKWLYFFWAAGSELLLLIFVTPYHQGFNHLPGWGVTVLTAFNLLAFNFLVSSVISHYATDSRGLRSRLQLESKKSESLLLSLFPEDIVRTLQNGQFLVAREYKAVTIMFIDIAGFTLLSSSLSPQGVVEMLNEVYSSIDALVRAYRLEKVKTIGDCYMVASGVPLLRADHALVTVKLAIDVRHLFASRTFLGRRLGVRIGIDSGAVVAGVIGISKFSYDVWGDTVNNASIIEQSGCSNEIRISERTRALVVCEFDCIYAGKVDMKGKGCEDIWSVDGCHGVNY